jgi:hypothetical protein
MNIDTWFSCLFLVLLGSFVYYGVVRAKRGAMPSLRSIAGLDAIDEAVGRAIEMGRPINYSTGLAAVDSEKAAETLASMDILGHVSLLCARMDCNLIVTNANPVIHSIASAVVTQSYRAAGAEAKLRPDTVRFLSSDQFAFTADVMGIMHREKVAANVFLGRFGSEALHLAETGSQLGAIQIAGTENMYQLPFFVTACDYTLIGEELYAAGAYLSGDPVRLGSIAGQDIAKMVCMVLLIVGSVLATFGYAGLADFFTKYAQ